MGTPDGIDFRCPHCQQQLRVPTFTAGTQIKCPDCNGDLEVPAAPTGIIGQSALSSPWPDMPTTKRRDDLGWGYGDKHPKHGRRSSSRGEAIIAPAICLLVVAALGLMFNLLGFVAAVILTDEPIDPQAPPMAQWFDKQTRGPLAATVQGTCAALSAFTIVGSIQMLLRKRWWLGLIACVLSMANIGNYCCILGLPFGIWALITLINADVRESFS